MNRLKGWKIALGAVLLILALMLVVNLTSERAAAAPLPGEIFIDHNGNRTYDVATETLYPTIQDAINAASPGDVIVVGSGVYEENLGVNVDSLSIVGPNENVDPIVGPRLPEAVVTPALTGATVDLQAITVTLNGLTFEGFNPNGSVAATYVIQNSLPSDGATISYNIIRNGTDGIYLDGIVAPGVGVLGTTISFNVIGNFSNAGAGTGVTLISDYFADVSLNLITSVDIGVLVRDMSLAGSPESVTSNTIDSRTYGVQVQNLFGTSDVWTVSANDVGPTTPGINTGIYISGVAANATVDLNFNSVHDCSIGLELQDNPTLLGMTARMELYINNSMGAYIVTGLISGVDLPNNYTFAAVEIDDSFTAIYMADIGDITSLTTLSVQESSFIIGGTDGIWVTGPLMVLIVNDTTSLPPLEFNTVAGNYITLVNNTRYIDATFVSFDGQTGGAMSLDQDFAVEDKVVHALDDVALGFVQWNFGEVYVTQLSGSIGRGLTVAVDGDSIFVGPGNFTEELFINKNVAFVGYGANLTYVHAPNLGSPYWFVTIDGSSAFVQGFTFSGPATNLLGGMLLVNSASATFLGNEFESLRDVAASQSVWAMQVGNATTSAYVDVSGSIFSVFAGGAIKIVNAPLGFSIFNNDITGSGTAIGDVYGQVGVKVESAVGGFIDSNRFTNFAGSEIGSCVEVDALSSGLNIAHNSFTGSNLITDNSAGIRMMGFGPTFVTLTGNNFSQWFLAIAIDGANHLLFADNYFTNNLGTAIGLHGTNDTTILRGAFTSNQNGIVALSGAVNNTARDVNFQGNGYALYNQNPEVFDARFNWWGHETGPGGYAPGLGDPIGIYIPNNILYNPWLGVPFPPEVPTNGTFQVLNSTHSVFFQGVGLNITGSMTGTGDHTVSMLQYFGNPNGVVYWKDAGIYFDFLILDTTGIIQVEMRAYYGPLDLPAGIVESELRAYWSDGGVWKACSDSGVNVAQHYVWVLIRADTSPSLAQIAGTPFLLGTPVATFDPTAGNVGSLVSALDGAGFNPSQKVTLCLEDTPIAQTFTDASGNFSFVRGFIPDALPGLYNIKVQDDSGFAVSGEFTVLDTTPIDITLDVGSLYFPGEVVTWYVMFALDGQLLDPDFVVANLYAPDGSVTDLSGDLDQLTMGLWTVSTTLAGDALPGEYTLVITANLIPTNYGATLRTFLVSPTLVDQYSRIVSMDGNITTIQTNIGVIMVDLSQISANLTSIEGTLATIQTSIGQLQADVNFINATLLSVQGTLVTIQTDIGSIVENISAINGRLTAIEGDIATIQTDIGTIQVDIADINAHLTSIDGTLVTIQTDIGSIQENCTAVNARLTALEGRLATIESDVGTIMVNVSQIDARLTSIEGRLATIETDIGIIVVNITAIKAQIVAIDGTLATIQTDIGACKANLTAIRAELVSVNMTVGTLSTTVGTLTVSLSALNVTVTRIDHNVATILTNMGTLTGRVTSLEGNVATIQTDIGTLKANVSALQKQTGETGGNNALVLGALGAGVIAALGGVVLLLRKKP